MNKFLALFLIFLLVGCGNVSGSGSTGPQVVIADVVEIALSVDTNGEIHLNGGVSIPTPIQGVVAVNWLVGFDLVLNEAQQTSNMLYILYDDGYGNIIQNAYDIGQPFEITFAKNEWVRKIKHAGNGSIVIFVERIPNEVVQPKQEPDNTVSQQSQPVEPVVSSSSSCPGAPTQRVVVGDKAYVCTQRDRLIVRKGPGKSEPEITRIVTGTNFVIVKGPICADSWSWWRIRTNDGVVGWVSEGGDSTDTYFFCPR